jgi:hypothetical protein
VRTAREVLIVFDEAQLRRVLRITLPLCNRVRTHWTRMRPDFPCPQRLGPIPSISFLGGLHRRCVRVSVFD